MRHHPISRFARAAAALLAWLVAPAVLLASGAAAVAQPAQAPAADACPPDAELFDAACVHDFYFHFDNADWEAELGRTAEPNNVHADLSYAGETYEDIGLRIKGLSSARVQGRKKPLNLTMDAFVPGQRLQGYDNLNFNNGFADPSGIREILTYDALRDHLPTPKAAFARVHINGAYFGQYLLVQQIERTYVREWFPSVGGLLIKADAPGGFGPGPALVQAGIPIGDGLATSAPDAREQAAGAQDDSQAASAPGARIVRTQDAPAPDAPQQGGFGLRSNLSWLGENLASYRQNYELKTSAAGDKGYTALRELIRVLDAPVASGGVSDADFPAAIERVLDVDAALWYFAANNLFLNFDSYYFGHNYFLYQSPTDGRFQVLLWDTNMSFGAFNLPGASPGGGTAGMAAADPLHMSTDATRPLLRRLLAVPRYRADYLAHFRDLRDAAFEIEALSAAGTAYHNTARDAVEADPNKLYSFDAFLQNLGADITQPGGRGQARAIPGVLSLARARSDWLGTAALLAAPDHRLVAQTQDPPQPASADAVAVTLEFAGADEPAAVELVYRVDAGLPVRLPLARDGQTWTGTIPFQPASAKVTYYARAAFADGRAAFHPAGNLLDPWSYRVQAPDLPVIPGGDLVINELMADNARTVADEAGEHDDWVEIYNRGGSPIALGDYYLSTNPDRPWAYRLPDMALPPGGYLLVWCDEDLFLGAGHADFRLSKGGETLLLSTRDAIVDQVTSPALATDQSYGRRGDGLADWDLCGRASPRAANACTGAEEVGGRLYLPVLERPN